MARRHHKRDITYYREEGMPYITFLYYNPTVPTWGQDFYLPFIANTRSLYIDQGFGSFQILGLTINGTEYPIGELPEEVWQNGEYSGELRLRSYNNTSNNPRSFGGRMFGFLNNKQAHNNFSLNQEFEPIIFTAPGITIPYGPGNQTREITVTSSINGEYVDFDILNIDDKPDWMVSITKGTPSGTTCIITIVVNENLEPQNRSFELQLNQHIANTRINSGILQGGLAISFIITKDRIDALYINPPVTYFAHSEYNYQPRDFQVTSKPDWVDVTITHLGGINYEVKVEFQDNNTSAKREGVITFAQNGTDKTGTTIVTQDYQTAVFLTTAETVWELTCTGGTVGRYHYYELPITSGVNNVWQAYTLTSTPDWIVVTNYDRDPGNTLTNSARFEIDRNWNQEDPRTGNVVFTQNDTGKTLTFTFNQLGTLTDGLPNEYPCFGVTKDTILGKQYQTVHLGEQIWLNEEIRWTEGNDPPVAPVNGQGVLVPQMLETWKNASGWTGYLPTADSYNSFFGYYYNKTGRNSFMAALQASQGGTERDDLHHNVPDWDMDFAEMFGFLSMKHGGPDNTLDKTLIKQHIGDIPSYDEKRRFYPVEWAELGIKKHGHNDEYGLAFSGNGSIQIYDPNSIDSTQLFVETFLNLSDPDDGDIWKIHWAYHTNGWHKSKDSPTSFHCKNIRTLRYRDLGWNLYDNGNELRKIRNGETIPEGFTVVPKGPMRGAWFARPDSSRNDCYNVGERIKEYLLKDWGNLG